MSSLIGAWGRLAAVAILLVLNGCAAVVGYRDTTAETVLSRRVLPQETSSRVVVDSERWIDGRSLTVSLKRVSECADVVQETVQVQRVRVAQTTNVALDIGLGALGIAAGTIALAISPTLSTQQTTDYNGNMSSARDEAVGIGLLSLAGGLVFGGNGIRTYLQARPQVVSTDKVVRDHDSENRPYGCGTTPVFDGTVAGTINDRSVPMGVTRTGAMLRIDARADLDEACSSGTSPADTARIVFHPADDPTAEVLLGSMPLSDCVNAAQARAHLMRAKILLNQAEGSSLLQAIDHVRESEKNWRQLARSDRDASTIRSDIDSMHNEVDTSVEKIGADPGALLPKGHFSPDDLLREGSAALVLAMQNPHSARAWSAVMKWIVAHVDEGAAGYLQLVSIVRRANMDECLISGWQCPAWLTTEVIETTMQGMTSVATRLIGVQAKQLLGASHALAQKVSLKGIENAEAAQAAAAPWTGACASDNQLQLASLQTSCKQLSAAALDVKRILDANADTVTRLREEAAKREHDEHEKKAMRDWRAQFGKCRKLRGALTLVDQLRTTGRCAAECEAGAAKMQKEAASLSQFQGDTQLDASDLEAVERECQEAGCPTCPGGNVE